MTRNEFILNAFKNSKCYYNASWVFSLFTVLSDKDRLIELKSPEDTRPYDIGVKDDAYHYFDETQKDWVRISDSPPITRPLYLVDETVDVPSQDDLLQRYETFPFKTRAGNLFVNHYILVSSLGHHVIPYQNGQMDISALENMVAPLISDDVNYIEEGNESTYITPKQAHDFSSACTSLSGFATIACPSASEYTLQPSPGIKEYREELYRQYGDKINDPAIAAMIDKKLVEYDKAHQAKDPDGGFYIDKKAYNVARKKMYVSTGYEQPEVSGGEGRYVKDSYIDGWDPKDLSIMIDSARDGSFNRGAMTALGGEAVKFIFRIFSTTRIVEEDCGTTLGIPRVLDKSNVKLYLGNTIILDNGEQVTLTEANMKDYIGQSVMVRSPGFCKTSHANFCTKCMGEALRGSSDSLASLASEVASQMMYVFMKKMHGVENATVKWDYRKSLS